ncbi:MAG: 3-deoxy-7-phosphoheptulonate synthase class II [Phycisphaerales bacterium]
MAESAPTAGSTGWTPRTWLSRAGAELVAYEDDAALERSVARLASLPPLVTSGEIEKLRGLLAEAEAGKRFVLQGGDCAEALGDCRPDKVTSTLKVLLQMSLVLIHGAKKPVVRIGRMAGQYAKPRSSATERRTVNGREVTLPSYFGDLINRAEFTPEARRPDPMLLLAGYQHAALTLNFVRALVDGGFADLHHPEYWDLRFVRRGTLAAELREEYERMTRTLGDGLRFMEAIGEGSIDQMTRADFFTSHEGLNLWYESAQTRRVPRREGYYCLTGHMPWIGERTRTLTGAHVELFRGVRNPVGVKVGPGATPAEVVALSHALNPANEPGKLVLISRLGASAVRDLLPPLLRGMASEGRRALWLCDPMHANGTVVGGRKTRPFDTIKAELEGAIEAHRESGVPLGGVHLELTGEDVTECLGGAQGVTPDDLATNYATACDPRLNYQQSLEIAFLLAHRLAGEAPRGPSGAGRR